ncbi:hypothetical protein FKP32DRAFT_1300970 [Trametes sanguinea]|nr:hypothetical protein FKP32DRAFT_1300970 [Trametes sanguinea]
MGVLSIESGCRTHLMILTVYLLIRTFCHEGSGRQSVWSLVLRADKHVLPRWERICVCLVRLTYERVRIPHFSVCRTMCLLLTSSSDVRTPRTRTVLNAGAPARRTKKTSVVELSITPVTVARRRLQCSSGSHAGQLDDLLITDEPMVKESCCFVLMRHRRVFECGSVMSPMSSIARGRTATIRSQALRADFTDFPTWAPYAPRAQLTPRSALLVIVFVPWRRQISASPVAGAGAPSAHIKPKKIPSTHRPSHPAPTQTAAVSVAQQAT